MFIFSQGRCEDSDRDKRGMGVGIIETCRNVALLKVLG